LTFQLGDLPVLSRSAVDRQEPLRDNEERQRELWPTALVVPVDRRGRFPVSEEGLALVPAAALGDSIVDGAVLLGESDGVAYWAVPADDEDARTAAATPAGMGPRGAGSAGVGSTGVGPAGGEIHWTDLRRSGAALDAMAAGLVVTAVAVLGWHRRSPYCGGCGRPSEWARAGWARRCAGCELEDYPRTDPAVICLVHDGADHVLVARGPEWPVNRFSVLAGFVEAGESLEACVVREVAEEVGVAVRDVRYLGSQPWPFPRSLMIGFHALADRSQPLKPADGEIAEARWVHRCDIRAALDRGSWADRTAPTPGSPAPGNPASGGPAELLLPGPVSIAGQMLTAWATTAS